MKLKMGFILMILAISNVHSGIVSRNTKILRAEKVSWRLGNVPGNNASCFRRLPRYYFPERSVVVIKNGVPQNISAALKLVSTPLDSDYCSYFNLHNTSKWILAGLYTVGEEYYSDTYPFCEKRIVERITVTVKESWLILNGSNVISVESAAYSDCVNDWNSK
jgi:hypothetical protein